MPELPEVEVVRAGLEPAVTGAVVTAVRIFDERSLRRHGAPADDFVKRLTGRTLETPRRRGKFLWIPIGSDEALVVHLGMSGQVLLRAPGGEDKLTRIQIDLGDQRLNFVDQRIFGSMAIDELVDAGHGETVPTQVAHIARDPLDPHFDERAFFAALSKRNTGIKRAMLDQGLISGIGNIYADESLWYSRIHYETPTATLTAVRKKLLLSEVRSVMLQALAEGGTSFDEQYKNVNGNSGYFERSLKVYGQQGEPCPRCGRPIVREQFMNRGSHFCPFCQRMPRVAL